MATRPIPKSTTREVKPRISVLSLSSGEGADALSSPIRLSRADCTTNCNRLSQAVFTSSNEPRPVLDRSLRVFQCPRLEDIKRLSRMPKLNTEMNNGSYHRISPDSQRLRHACSPFRRSNSPTQTAVILNRGTTGHAVTHRQYNTQVVSPERQGEVQPTKEPLPALKPITHKQVLKLLNRKGRNNKLRIS